MGEAALRMSEMPLNDLPWWAQMLGGGGIATAALKAADFFLTKESRQVRALNASVQGLSEQLQRADNRSELLEKRLDECDNKHRECEGRVTKLEKDMHEEIRRLMVQNPAAGYRPADLRRVGPKK